MIERTFDGLQREGRAQRNAEHDRTLPSLLGEPLQHPAKVGDLLVPGDALRVVPRRVPAPPLVPVPHEEVALEVQPLLKLRDLVQQWQARAGLHDEQRRPPLSPAQADALTRPIDVEIDRSVHSSLRS